MKTICIKINPLTIRIISNICAHWYDVEHRELGWSTTFFGDFSLQNFADLHAITMMQSNDTRGQCLNQLYNIQTADNCYCYCWWWASHRESSIKTASPLIISQLITIMRHFPFSSENKSLMYITVVCSWHGTCIRGGSSDVQ